MSNVNNQFKELVNEAIHNHFHDKTETEMILKDWLYGICEQLGEYEAKAEAYDDIRYAMEMQTAIGVSDEDALIDIHHVIMRLIERMGSGGSDD